MLCKLNRDCLREIFHDSFSILELEPTRVTSMAQTLAAFRGHIDGVNARVITQALEKVDRKNISVVFIDGSNLGEITAQLKKRAPSIKIATFFHNVESRFFLGSFRASKTPRALAVLVANYLAERKAVRYSDALIAMNERDSTLLRRVYGRGATAIAPMALADQATPSRREEEENNAPIDEKYLLFVGGGFYANRQGVIWFAKNVAPHIALRTIAVGKGLEQLASELGDHANVEIIGAVRDLSVWYRGAHCVIAPIFDGSGMKTKVAEALMFGKRVIGTPEAFCGYEEIADQAGWICTNAKEFLNTIERVQNMELPHHDPKVRALFERSYSYGAARARLAGILNALTQA